MIECFTNTEYWNSHGMNEAGLMDSQFLAPTIPVSRKLYEHYDLYING